MIEYPSVIHSLGFKWLEAELWCIMLERYLALLYFIVGLVGLLVIW